ncbi:MAG TPA: hypothetical protein DIW54_14250 [Chitinophagaceae bacterium]|nr:hypothetical protein [Chitinophagaceae bacterium]
MACSALIENTAIKEKSYSIMKVSKKLPHHYISKVMLLRKLAIAVCLTVSIACSKKEATSTPTPTNPTPTPAATRLINLPTGWKYASLLSAAFPAGVELYFFDTLFQGRKTKAFCLAYDSKRSNIEFKPVLSATLKKPSDFYKEEAGVVYGCLNGGFFGGSQSFSLVQYNGVVQSANIKSVSRSFNGVSTAYYPTRAAFGITSTGSPMTAWIYHVGAGNNDIYAYPSPSPNVEGSAPQAVPTESFPAGATRWTTTSAIGGSPMLVRNSNVLISDAAELISINNNTSRPRSAIGFNSNGIVLLLAVEGDNTAAGYTGLNLTELANMLKDLNCVEAINLDGGGSTSMVVANQLLVRPGDSGVERPVISVIIIKQK